MTWLTVERELCIYCFLKNLIATGCICNHLSLSIIHHVRTNNIHRQFNSTCFSLNKKNCIPFNIESTLMKLELLPYFNDACIISKLNDMAHCWQITTLRWLRICGPCLRPRRWVVQNPSGFVTLEAPRSFLNRGSLILQSALSTASVQTLKSFVNYLIYNYLESRWKKIYIFSLGILLKVISENYL